MSIGKGIERTMVVKIVLVRAPAVIDACGGAEDIAVRVVVREPWSEVGHLCVS